MLPELFPCEREEEEVNGIRNKSSNRKYYVYRLFHENPYISYLIYVSCIEEAHIPRYYIFNEITDRLLHMTKLMSLTGHIHVRVLLLYLWKEFRLFSPKEIYDLGQILTIY